MDKSKHPENKFVPCCMSLGTGRIEEAFDILENQSDNLDVSGYNYYIQAWGKELSVSPKKTIGLLPDYLNNLLGNLPEICETGISNERIYIRAGIKKNGDSFLNLIARLISESEESEISTIKLKQLITVL